MTYLNVTDGPMKDDCNSRHIPPRYYRTPLLLPLSTRLDYASLKDLPFLHKKAGLHRRWSY